MAVFPGGDPDTLTPEERLDRLSDLAPSAKFVFKVLHRNGTLSQDEICAETLLPKRTVRHALDTLESADLVVEEQGVRDARTRRYSPELIEHARF